MERVKTGIAELDKMLSGGLYKGSVTQVKGAAGTGKSTLGLQFIYTGASQYGEPGLIVTFEEFPETYYRDALSLGWDIRKLEGGNKVKVIFTSPALLQEELKEPESTISTLIREMNIERVLVDSISHFRQLTTDPVELRGIFYTLINALRREGATAILTSESPDIMGETKMTTAGLGFIVDNIILLRYVEIESELRRALLILKMRGSDHAKEIREYKITSKGIEIAKKFEGREGVLTGTPKSITLARALEEAFSGKRE